MVGLQASQNLKKKPNKNKNTVNNMTYMIVKLKVKEIRRIRKSSFVPNPKKGLEIRAIVNELF